MAMELVENNKHHKQLVMKRITQVIVIILMAGALFDQNAERPNTLVFESNFILSASISYDRILNLSEKVDFYAGADYWMGIGFGEDSHWVSPEVGGVFFGPKHNLETGNFYAFRFSPDADDWESEDSSFVMNTAYRLETKKGIIFKLTANILPGIDPIFIPTIGVGYAF